MCGIANRYDSETVNYLTHGLVLGGDVARFRGVIHFIPLFPCKQRDILKDTTVMGLQ